MLALLSEEREGMRATGFYRVKADGWWQIAYWLEGDGWNMVGELYSRQDETLDEIGDMVKP